METAKKVKIVISTLVLEEVIDILNTLRVNGYTVIKDVWGKGGHGTYYNDLGLQSGNSYILTVCKDEKQVNYLIDELLPILKKIGGIFLVTDSDWQHF